ncbi:MAG: TolC family protein [Proteobacteria bacterium]|nr:TolC family protein [Pseudomonadota bacterium]MBU1389598.1 TolC family protein [Pseudomonadota bacterium]MBU1544462.1 TolC family protein [Pseudomonadota bacterium]MBU2481004.1 TolC family protein [Pseudomonadota bacterium]
MKKNVYCLFVMICVLAASVKSADCATLYSLFDLSQIAFKQSETIKIAQDDLYIAQQDKARALSVLIPRATVYSSITRYKEEDALAPNTLSMGGMLTQSFTLNGKELIALNVTIKTIESKEFSLDSIRSQYLLQVANAYYNILSAQQYLKIAESDVQRLKTHKDAVQEKLNVGNVTKTALFRAQAELSKSMTELEISKNRVLKAKAALRNLVNIEDDFELQKKDVQKIETYESVLKEIQDYALANRSEIKEARKNLEIAEKTIAYEQSSYWPTVSLEAGYVETEIAYDTAGREHKSDSEDLYFKGELSFTLFDGGLRKAQIRQAKAAERKARNALTLQEKLIILDSENSYRDYTAAKSTLINLQDELKASQENFNAVQMQFEYGMADSIDMMDANTLLVSAQRRILDAKYTYYLSVLNILYTRGDLMPFLLSQK